MADYTSDAESALSDIRDAGATVTIRRKDTTSFYSPMESYYTANGLLNAQLSSTATSLTMDTITGSFGSQGTLGIGAEMIQYDKKAVSGATTTLHNLTRAYNYTRSRIHADNDGVYLLGPQSYSDYSAYGVFLNYKESQITGTLIHKGDRKCLIAASGLAIEVEQGDVVISGSKQWNVESVNVLNFDDVTNIIYTAQLRSA